MRTLQLAVCALAVAGCAEPLQSQESPPDPVALVRSLRVTQDRVVHGDAAAHQAQKATLGQLAVQFDALDEKAWKDVRNARAAVTFVLSGGNPRILRKLLAIGAPDGIDPKLIEGALAYGEGRNGDAADLLLSIEARALEPVLAGHVALVQSELVSKKDVARATALLDEARLLSPGTLIEEAALRRQVAAVAGDFDRLLSLSVRYLYRFPNSLYAGNFRREFATLAARNAPVGDAERLKAFEMELAALDPPDLREIYLAVAKEGLIKGNLDVARFAAQNVLKSAEGGGPDAERAQLYAAAVDAIINGSPDVLEALSRNAGSPLGVEDMELLVAVRVVAGEVSRPGPSVSPTAAQIAEMNKSVAVAARARATIERVDQLLSEASR